MRDKEDSGSVDIYRAVKKERAGRSAGREK
jgi:hypothetical protein